MFTSDHFIWIGICAVLITVLSIISIRCRFSFKTASLIMAAIAFFSELSKALTHMEFANGADLSEGMVIDATSLPLHLCSLLIFVFFFLPFCKNEALKKKLLSFVVPVSILGGLLAIVMATSGTDFAKPYAYQCFIYHAGIIWFAIYLLATGQVDLGIKAWSRNLITLLALAMVMLWVNGALQVYETNFFFLVRPPVDGLPLLNLDHGWYAYFATILICGFVGITLVHFPFLCKERKKAKISAL